MLTYVLSPDSEHVAENRSNFSCEFRGVRVREACLTGLEDSLFVSQATVTINFNSMRNEAFS
jgi:hypothetical protein